MPYEEYYYHYLFRFFGHPEVYILILSGIEIISHIICHERGKLGIIGNLGAIFANIYEWQDGDPAKMQF